jgi:hypothetical protein
MHGKDSPHMIEKNIWFKRAVGRGSNVDLASDEPSHIHIPRPSRVRRQDNSGSSLELTDELRDLAADQVTMQAA